MHGQQKVFTGVFKACCVQAYYSVSNKTRTRASRLTGKEFHGIAFDEQSRCNKNTGRNIRYPLVEWGITEKQALENHTQKTLRHAKKSLLWLHDITELSDTI
jgi:hypothetical protein